MEQHCIPSHQQRTQHYRSRSLSQQPILHQPAYASATTPACQGICLHVRSETLQLPRQLQPGPSYCGRCYLDISVLVYSGSTAAEAVSMAAIKFVFCRLCYHLRWSTIVARPSLLVVYLSCKCRRYSAFKSSAVDISRPFHLPAATIFTGVL